MDRSLSDLWPAEKRLVLGVGSGRTGSESLAYLLDVQPDGCVSHEFSLFCAEGHRAARHRPPLAWDTPRAEAREAIIGLSRHRGTIVGDAGSYWLPQLAWVLEELENVRVVGVTRDRASVVRSFLEKSTNRNHWMRHDGAEWVADPVWDPAFPKYDCDDKEEAIGRYWDDYYGECDRLVAAHPDRFRLWPLKSLSDPVAAREILLFAGHDPERLNLKRLAPRNKRKSPFKKFAKWVLGRE